MKQRRKYSATMNSRQNDHVKTQEIDTEKLTEKLQGGKNQVKRQKETEKDREQRQDNETDEANLVKTKTN